MQKVKGTVYVHIDSVDVVVRLPAASSSTGTVSASPDIPFPLSTASSSETSPTSARSSRASSPQPSEQTGCEAEQGHDPPEHSPRTSLAASPSSPNGVTHALGGLAPRRSRAHPTASPQDGDGADGKGDGEELGQGKVVMTATESVPSRPKGFTPVARESVGAVKQKGARHRQARKARETVPLLVPQLYLALHGQKWKTQPRPWHHVPLKPSLPSPPSVHGAAHAQDTPLGDAVVGGGGGGDGGDTLCRGGQANHLHAGETQSTAAVAGVSRPLSQLSCGSDALTFSCAPTGSGRDTHSLASLSTSSAPQQDADVEEGKGEREWGDRFDDSSLTATPRAGQGLDQGEEEGAAASSSALLAAGRTAAARRQSRLTELTHRREGDGFAATPFVVPGSQRVDSEWQQRQQPPPPRACEDVRALHGVEVLHEQCGSRRVTLPIGQLFSFTDCHLRVSPELAMPLDKGFQCSSLISRDQAGDRQHSNSSSAGGGAKLTQQAPLGTTPAAAEPPFQMLGPLDCWEASLASARNSPLPTSLSQDSPNSSIKSENKLVVGVDSVWRAVAERRGLLLDIPPPGAGSAVAASDSSSTDVHRSRKGKGKGQAHSHHHLHHHHSGQDEAGNGSRGALSKLTGRWKSMKLSSRLHSDSSLGRSHHDRGRDSSSSDGRAVDIPVKGMEEHGRAHCINLDRIFTWASQQQLSSEKALPVVSAELAAQQASEGAAEMGEGGLATADGGACFGRRPPSHELIASPPTSPELFTSRTGQSRSDWLAAAALVQQQRAPVAAVEGSGSTPTWSSGGECADGEDDENGDVGVLPQHFERHIALPLPTSEGGDAVTVKLSVFFRPGLGPEPF